MIGVSKPCSPGGARHEYRQPDDAIGQMNERLGAIESRLDTLEERMDARFNQVDSRFNEPETRIDDRFQAQEQRIRRWIYLMLFAAA